MTSSTKLPENLWPLRDLLIEQVHAGDSFLPEVKQIYEWLADEGWDELVGPLSNEEMVLNLNRFCENDGELQAILDLDESVEITDEIRVYHFREQISKSLSGIANYDSSTVVFYLMESSGGKSAVIGAMLSVQQGGWDVDWDGVFLTAEEYVDQLRESGIWLARDIEKIDDSTIISFWNT